MIANRTAVMMLLLGALAATSCRATLPNVATCSGLTPPRSDVRFKTRLLPPTLDLADDRAVWRAVNAATGYHDDTGRLFRLPELGGAIMLTSFANNIGLCFVGLIVGRRLYTSPHTAIQATLRMLNWRSISDAKRHALLRTTIKSVLLRWTLVERAPFGPLRVETSGDRVIATVWTRSRGRTNPGKPRYLTQTQYCFGPTGALLGSKVIQRKRR